MRLIKQDTYEASNMFHLVTFCLNISRFNNESFFGVWIFEGRNTLNAPDFVLSSIKITNPDSIITKYNLITKCINPYLESKYPLDIIDQICLKIREFLGIITFQNPFFGINDYAVDYDIAEPLFLDPVPISNNEIIIETQSILDHGPREDFNQ